MKGKRKIEFTVKLSYNELNTITAGLWVAEEEYRRLNNSTGLELADEADRLANALYDLFEDDAE